MIDTSGIYYVTLTTHPWIFHRRLTTCTILIYLKFSVFWKFFAVVGCFSWATQKEICLDYC